MQNESASPADWLPLPERAFSARFPTGSLPVNFSNLIRNISTAYQVSEAMTAAFALGVCSAAITGRVEIQPKAKEPFYKEAGQIYILCEGASGERKTPVLNALKAPLESSLNERRDFVRAENSAILRKIKIREKAAQKTRKLDEAESILKEVDELKKRLKPEPEYLMSDLTMEAVGQAMEDHAGRAIVLFDEADFLSVLTGRSYSKEGSAANLLPALTGYTNSELHGKRVGRGEWHIPRASLSICLGVQPQLLAGFMNDVGGIDRGLHARFLYFVPESRIGTRKSDGGSLDASNMGWWTNLIARLASTAREGSARVMKFDAYAEAAYRAFWQRIENRLAGDLSGNIQSWGGKLAGNAVRLAGLIALTDGEEDTVCLRHWEAAEAIAEKFLIPCAVRLFLGDDPSLTDTAKALLPLVRQTERFKQSELWREKARYRIKDKKVYEAAIQNLWNRGYIRPSQQQDERAAHGPEPSTWYDVHPDLINVKGRRALQEIVI